MIEFTFWNVQHGHATLLRTPNKCFVFDLGTGQDPRGDRFSPLQYMRRNLGIRAIDGLVLTHPHRDHIDDITELINIPTHALRRPVHLSEIEIRRGNRPQDSAVIESYLAINSNYNAPFPAGADPFLPANNGGVEFKFFHPGGTSTNNLNNHSIVSVISYMGLKMLIPGDNEAPSWDELLTLPDFIETIGGTNVLLAPHHGRDAGYSSQLMRHISPAIIVISDGRYGDTSATDRYSNHVVSHWPVAKRSGGVDRRKCVTTRRDGHIEVRFSAEPYGRRLLDVLID